MSERLPHYQFPVGEIQVTPTANEMLTRNGEQPLFYVHRHASGDWGELTDEQTASQNDQATFTGETVHSHYRVNEAESLRVETPGTREHTSLWKSGEERWDSRVRERIREPKQSPFERKVEKLVGSAEIAQKIAQIAYEMAVRSCPPVAEPEEMEKWKDDQLNTVALQHWNNAINVTLCNLEKGFRAVTPTENYDFHKLK